MVRYLHISNLKPTKLGAIGVSILEIFIATNRHQFLGQMGFRLHTRGVLDLVLSLSWKDPCEDHDSADSQLHEKGPLIFALEATDTTCLAEVQDQLTCIGCWTRHSSDKSSAV